MENMTERFEGFVLKFERLEDGLKKRSETLLETEQVMLNLRKQLALEIEELKSVKQGVEVSLTSNIGKSIKENINNALPQVMPKLISEFSEKTEKISEEATNNALKTNSMLEESVRKACKTLETRKTSLTHRAAFMAGIFCVSSLLTATSINYFFPTHVHYEMSPQIAYSFLLGNAVIEMYDELTPQQKDRLASAQIKQLKKGAGNR